jgi:hypothetical protein
MGFEDLDQFLDDGLDLPVGGVTYRIPAPDAMLGLWCQRLCAAGFAVSRGEEPPGNLPKAPDLNLDDEDEHALYRRLCGDAWDQMIKAGVSWPKLQVVGTTVLLWVGLGQQTAEAYWRSGGDPNSLGPTRRQRRALSSTVTASSTRKPDSTSGTKSRRTKPAA